MDDLRRRFASLDRVRAPDLWNAIERRAAAGGATTRVSAVVRPAGMPSGRSSRRQLVLLLAVAALLAALVVGAFVTGSLRPDLLAIVVNPPATVVPPETAAPSAAPAASPAPATPTAVRSWMTGQELMDALAAGYGYRWSPNVDSDSMDTSFQSGRILAEAPFDGPAKVSLMIDTKTVAEAGLHAGRIAQALAPDAAPWIQEAITQGLGADWGSFVSTPAFGVDFAVFHEKDMVTASGGQVAVEFLDPPVFGHGPLRVTFVLPPAPPAVRSEPVEPGSVVYADSGLIRVENPNGTDAGTLLGGPFAVERVLGWSPDGSRLFYLDPTGTLMATDSTGSEPALIGRSDRPQDRCTKLSDAALQAKCVADLAGISERELCPDVTVGDTCTNVDEIVISPDGTRVAYPISDDSGRDVIGFLDIATGQVTRISFDSERRPGGRGCEGPPAGGGPFQWSPDGTRFAFGKSIGPKVDGWCQSAIFTVNVDGTDLRRLTSSNVHGMNPRWSPDGSTIVFSSLTPRSAWDGGDATRIPIDTDIYSVRPDGSGLTALTSDGVSLTPFWTRDGRIVFSHVDPGGTAELWIMDGDGSNPTRLDTTIAAQTAAGCTVCPSSPSEGDPDQNGLVLRFWRPGQP
jgi:hypothetical protein